MRVGLVPLENAIRRQGIKPTDFFALALSEDELPTVIVQKVMLLHNQLYRVTTALLEEIGHRALRLVEHSGENSIMYRATSSSLPEEYTWHGMDLETAEAGTFDYDAMMGTE